MSQDERNCIRCGKVYTYDGFSKQAYGKRSDLELCPDCMYRYLRQDDNIRKEREHIDLLEERYPSGDCSACHGTGEIKGYRCVKCDGKGKVANPEKYQGLDYPEKDKNNW